MSVGKEASALFLFELLFLLEVEVLLQVGDAVDDEDSVQVVELLLERYREEALRLELVQPLRGDRHVRAVEIRDAARRADAKVAQREEGQLPARLVVVHILHRNHALGEITHPLELCRAGGSGGIMRAVSRAGAGVGERAEEWQRAGPGASPALSLSDGMMLPAAARPPRQSFLEGPSTVFCVAVVECTVDIKPSLIPKLS